MYQIQRKSRICEELAVLDKDGNIAHTLQVDINIDDFVGRWNKARADLDNANKMLNEDPSNVEAYGRAVIALLVLIFGEEQTNILLNHYENNYGELLLDVFPFINEVIIPKVTEASAARKEQLRAAAKLSKKRG